MAAKDIIYCKTVVDLKITDVTIFLFMIQIYYYSMTI